VGRLAGLLFDAQVEPKPHQIDAVLFALQTPFLKGVILADEVGLGKTIEAGLIISQFWEEKKRKILIISPSSLRQQWQQELSEKFHLSSTVIDSNSLKDYEKQHGSNLLTKEGIYICSYEFANSNVDKLKTGWDLLIADEAHKLRNYWTGRAKVAESIANIVQKSTNKTIFLTATPLQNKLEELYGLVSIFDPKYFYSLEAFKERYIKNRDLDDYDDLAQRVRQISKRTLRKTAQKYIHYTERLPLTVKFKPSPQEQQLYEMVNEYLQRDELFAFSQSQRHLSSLIIRKRLGSSTYAVASTLENIATRLEDELNTGKRRNNSGKLFFDDDIHDEELEEIEQQADSFESVNQSMAAAIKEEIIELRQFASLARSIIVNEKAVKLNDALEQGFHKLKEIGAPEKAIIFTDSTKTQEYIARSLSENGYADDVVLFNGANDSPQSNQIYREWLAKNKDSDLS
jgi:SNF2 family DNA or RNA helicase